ncbi:arginine--tRNA ligase [Novispirillum itersonii]|uniref:arginine--tRNA ligase n=1 Tax=Novispirillum itersonii TaxID=189 RepID=UPI00035C7A0D|nr:arginine--tRNA ligase [Novispirillum itersonii]
MNLFTLFHSHVLAVIDGLVASGTLPAGLKTAAVTVEPPRDPSHGDISTNAAMVLAKAAGMKPRDLADHIAAGLKAVDGVTAVEIAGPGFINLRVAFGLWADVLRHALRSGTGFGDSDIGQGVKVNVEYVSANPTGPMHVGHARGACVGDALANLLAKAGFDVAKEYYINDAGAQVDVLARALRARYLVACGAITQDEFDRQLAAKEIQYGGEYLVETAEVLKARDGERWVNAPEEEWIPALREFGIAEMMKMIREDLDLLGVRHDVFTSELGMVQSGEVVRAKELLDSKGLLYVGVLEPPKGKTPDDWEPRPQTLFKATDFGDDVDRPLMKSDGSWTYFASDIAYHGDKYRRGFTQMIDVLGADHGGYVKRMQAAVRALSDHQAELDVKLCQLVKLLENGEPVKMSKRAGTFVTLREVVERVGKDVVRFIMLSRKNDMALEFDYAKVTEQSKDNPVFYVQYAYARIQSVKRHFVAAMPGTDLSAAALAGADLSLLADSDEQALVKLIACWPRLVEAAAEVHEPHRIAFALTEVAGAFHALWNKGRENADLRFLIADNPALSLARLALLEGVATVIASGLDVLGVVPVEEM